MVRPERSELPTFWFVASGPRDSPFFPVLYKPCPFLTLWRNLALAMITQNSRESREIDAEPSKSIVRKSNHFQFTERRIEKLPPSSFPNGRRAYYYDDEVRGLCVAVAPTGRKNFVL